MHFLICNPIHYLIDYSLVLQSRVDRIEPKRRMAADFSKAASFRMFLHSRSTHLKQVKRGKMLTLFLSAVNIQIIDLIGLTLRFLNEATFNSFAYSLDIRLLYDLLRHLKSYADWKIMPIFGC